MHRLLRWTCAFFLAAGVAAPAHAQMRTLEVPANKGWKHAQTGVVLRSTSVYASFDRLPHPDLALKLVQSSSPMSRSTRGSKEIVIGVPAK